MPRRRRLSGAARTVALLVLALAQGGPPRAACQPPPAGSPDTLFLSLDGVAYEVVRAAQREGSFAGWPEVRPLVSTFPSMTNVAFTAIFSPLARDRMDGYEMRHYDWETNKIRSGSANYAERAGDWRDHYDVMHYSMPSTAKGYLMPRSDIFDTLEEIERFALEQPSAVMLGHIKSTDVLAHFRGNDAVGEVVRRLAARLDALAASYRERHGRELRFVLFSDHGNTEQKVYFRQGIRERLRAAGLHPNDRLDSAEDVVTPTYGAVSFGVLFTDPANAERAARAVIDHEAVDLAAWIAEPGVVRVISDEGEARLLAREAGGQRRFAYEALSGDPLRLAAAVSRLRREGRIDGDGFADEDDWFAETAEGEYPDPIRRLVDSLEGRWVRNAATVILSFEQGYAWGQAVVRFGAYVGGGHQEGTHGGLDRESSLGFFLTSDPAREPAGPLRADRALADWAALLACHRPAGERRLAAGLAADPTARPAAGVPGE